MSKPPPGYFDSAIAEIKAVNDYRNERYEARQTAEVQMKAQGPWFDGVAELPCGHAQALDTRRQTRITCARCDRQYVVMGVSVSFEAEDY
jgi:hypothetical protein